MMKKILVYFFGGIACMGVGAGVYIAMGLYLRPAAVSLPFAKQMTTVDAVNELLPLVGKSLAGKVVGAVVPPAPEPIAKPTTIFLAATL